MLFMGREGSFAREPIKTSRDVLHLIRHVHM
jgi:hypothetical protein